MSNKLTSYSSIAVSGQACSGKSTICTLLAGLLGWEHVNIGAEFRKLAASYKLEIKYFGSIPTEQLKKVDQEIITRIHKEPQSIWDGRLACYFSRDVPSCLKVYCMLPTELRSQRLAKRENLLLADAENVITDRDTEENKVFERLYGLSNPFDPKWVNLTVDTSDSPEELTKQILEKINR